MAIQTKQPPIDPDRLYTMKETATRLGVSKPTLRVMMIGIRVPSHGATRPQIHIEAVWP